ncbi:hypothetical protein IW261DRAFT_1424940 [Armillaria novae-zelandiae]|uniref:Uncharacterized protein n=1 Tax=Armillaria novae-zelandiae TaxID=153914 RepID=A0AA39NTQ9_9AGAR|nr:hypothetical protein IW261DRAFT_1424940 [Armillaria novae-zelandiae]
MSNPNVLFIRDPTPSSDCGQDRYEPAFTKRNYAPVSISVLETLLTNITWSSPWDKANGTGKVEFPFYFIGKATASMLHSSMFNAHIHGEHSGTVQQLAIFILTEQPHLRNCCVQDLRQFYILAAIVPVRPSVPQWIVFFAPSAAEFVLKFQSLHSNTSSATSWWNIVFIFRIGRPHYQTIPITGSNVCARDLLLGMAGHWACVLRLFVILANYLIALKKKFRWDGAGSQIRWVTYGFIRSLDDDIKAGRLVKKGRG